MTKLGLFIRRGELAEWLYLAGRVDADWAAAHRQQLQQEQRRHGSIPGIPFPGRCTGKSGKDESSVFFGLSHPLVDC